MARAVTQHGYAACDRAFPTWVEVIAFARGEVARRREAEGRPIPDAGVGRAFLRGAPASAIERFLDRIRTELLPRDDLDAAATILQAIQIESPRLLELPVLARRTAELLEDVLRRKEARLEEHVREDDRFPRLASTGRLPRTRAYARKRASARSLFMP